MSWFNFETMIAFLRDFILCHPENGRKIVIVLDNAPWHKKAVRLITQTDEYTDLARRIEFIMLHPYSPDLNPIERVWRITRREVSYNRFFRCLDDLRYKLLSYFKELSRPNEKLASLCSLKSKT